MGNDESISGLDQCGRTPRMLDGGAVPLLLMRAALMDLENSTGFSVPENENSALIRRND